MDEALLQGRNALVLDDDPLLLRLVSDCLSPYGMRVTPAQRAADAIALLESTKPDIILCDIVMPDVDGHAFHQRVRSHAAWRRIPFVYLSPLGDYPAYRHSMNLGADGCLAKPFTRRRLVQEVAHVLSRRQEVTGDLPVRIALLGGHTVRRGAALLSAPDRGAEQLVFYLLLRPSGVQPKQVVVEELWGEITASGFRSVLSRARRWSTGWLEWHICENAIRIALSSGVSCDLYALEAALDRGVSGRHLEALYGGELLPGYSQPWAQERRERLIERLKARFVNDARALTPGVGRARRLRRALVVNPHEIAVWEEYIDNLDVAGLREEADQARSRRDQLLG